MPLHRSFLKAICGLAEPKKHIQSGLCGLQPVFIPMASNLPLKQGPLLTKLKQKILHSKKVDIGLGETSFKPDQWYLRPDENGFLVPINVETATSLDGTASYIIQKDLDTVNDLYFKRPTGIPGDVLGTSSKHTTVVDENNRYAYVDSEDGMAYQLLYNKGTKSYYYTNSKGNHVVFPAQDVEQLLGQIDAKSNTVHFTAESLQESLSANNPHHINNLGRGAYFDSLLDNYAPPQESIASRRHAIFNPPSQDPLMPSWLKISSIQERDIKFQLQLLFSQTLQPMNHPEVLIHHPFDLAPRAKSSDGLNASLQALFHLNSINQIAKVAPAVNEFEQYVPPNTIGTYSSSRDRASAVKLNLALRALAQVGQLPPVPLPKHDSSSTSPSPLSITQQSTQTLIPPQQSLLIANPLLSNSPVPSIPQIITDTIVNTHNELNENWIGVVANPNDPKLITSMLLKHLQSQFDVIFNPTVSQLSPNRDQLFQVRNDLLQGMNGAAFRFRGTRDDLDLELSIGGSNQLKSPVATTTGSDNVEINHTVKFDHNGSPYKTMSSLVSGNSAQDVSSLLSLKRKINLECTCGKIGPELTTTTSSLLTLSPADLARHNNSIYQYLRIKRARPYIKHQQDLPPGLADLPCNHHHSLYRHQFQQFLISRWRADPKSNHFGVVFPRVAQHPGAKRDVFNNMSLHVPFLAPIHTRDPASAVRGSTNISLYYLQSFIVYDDAEESALCGDDNTNQSKQADLDPSLFLNEANPAHLVAPEQRLGDGVLEQGGPLQNQNNGEKSQLRPRFVTYGNISSNGSPSWWYRYRDNYVTKVPIDTVVRASNRLFLGFYTKMPLSDVFLKFYYNIHEPRKRQLAVLEEKRAQAQLEQERHQALQQQARTAPFSSPRNAHV